MEITDYKKKLASLGKKIAKLHAERSTLLEELRSVCPHTNVTTKEQYHHGGYDYSASSTYTHTCTDCRASSTETISHKSGFE